MDRPEWIDTFPAALTAIATLTNNTAHGVAERTRARGNRTQVQPPQPRSTEPVRAPGALGLRARTSTQQPSLPGHLHPRRRSAAVPGRPVNNDQQRVRLTRQSFVAPGGRSSRQCLPRGTVLGSPVNAGGGPLRDSTMLGHRPRRPRGGARWPVGRGVYEIAGVFRRAPNQARRCSSASSTPAERRPACRTTQPTPPQFSAPRPTRPAARRPRSACIVTAKDDGGVN